MPWRGDACKEAQGAHTTRTPETHTPSRRTASIMQLMLWDGRHWTHTFLLLSDNNTPLLCPTNLAPFLPSIFQESLPKPPRFCTISLLQPSHSSLIHFGGDKMERRSVSFSSNLPKDLKHFPSEVFLSPCTPKSSSSSAGYMDKTFLNFSSLLSNLTFGTSTKC